MNFRKIVVGIGLLVGALAAHAQPVALTCPGNVGEPLPAATALPALAAELDARMSACERDAGFLAWRGAVLNALGRPAEAAAVLERALLINPDHAGARLDYALALATLGERDSATALLDSLLVRPDIPPRLRDSIVAGREQIAALRWRTGGSLSLHLGYDSNLNSAPKGDQLTLDLPDGPVNLAYADSYRPRAAAVALLAVTGHAQTDLGEGRQLALQGELRQRQTPVAAHDYRQVDAQARLASRLAADAQASLTLGASALDYGGESLYQSLRAALQRDWAIPPCRPRLGLEVETRTYLVNRQLDGRFAALSGGLSCTLPIVGALLFSARAGLDRAQSASRPGGDQTRLDLRLLHTRPFGPGWIEADAQFARQRDAETYSALLAGGAHRQIDRLTLRLDYAQPVIAPGWEARIGLELLRQSSNLSLFDIAGQSLWFGLRRTWP